MTQYFFDTSALVKRYHQEEGAARVREVFSTPESVVRISTLGVVEIHSAFAIKVRSQQITQDAAQVLIDGVLADLVSGRVEPYSVRDRHYSDARRLVRRFAFDYRLRSLDAIQLSIGLDLQSQGLADVLVTADRTVQEIAGMMGLPVLNPQTR